jgi:hypothetical protein
LARAPGAKPALSEKTGSNGLSGRAVESLPLPALGQTARASAASSAAFDQNLGWFMFAQKQKNAASAAGACTPTISEKARMMATLHFVNPYLVIDTQFRQE